MFSQRSLKVSSRNLKKCFFFLFCCSSILNHFYNFDLCWRYHCVYSFFSWIWWATLWSLLLTLSGRLLIFISLRSFSEILSCFVWNIFLYLLILSDSLFISMYYLPLTVLKEWPCAIVSHRVQKHIPPGCPSQVHKVSPLCGLCVCLLCQGRRCSTGWAALSPGPAATWDVGGFSKLFLSKS